MSETYIPLKEALDDGNRRQSLLERLKEGKISAYAPMSFGGKLVEWRVASSYEEIVSSLFRLDVEKRVALRHIESQESRVKYIWDQASRRYLAIFEDVNSEVVAFTSDDRGSGQRVEVPRSFWRHAYVDESRDTVVYDDWQELWRKVFARVQIDDGAVALVDRSLVQPSVRLGRHDVYRDSVARYAKELIVADRSLKQFDYIRKIKEKFGNAGSRNTLIKHYGDIWREHVAKPPVLTQKPKKPQ